MFDSKALSTGEGNAAESNNFVFGFASQDGYGNIFERCVANSTQGVHTTDSDSIIAGFALRGSEKCSKIVDSEGANAVSDITGFTVPHGIFLEGTIDSVQSVTGLFGSIGDINTVDWSADGKYLAVGGADFAGGTSNELQIFTFNGSSGALTAVTGALPENLNGSVRSVNWSSEWAICGSRRQ